MTNCTPAPWAYDSLSGDVIYDDGDISPSICGIYDNAEPAQQHADGRLIAAAPDLLKALISANEALAMCEPRTRHGADCATAAQLAARAAIAKARGE